MLMRLQIFHHARWHDAVVWMERWNWHDTPPDVGRTRSDIETDKISPSLSLLNRAFRPFGLTVGLLPRSPALRQRLLKREQAS